MSYQHRFGISSFRHLVQRFSDILLAVLRGRGSRASPWEGTPRAGSGSGLALLEAAWLRPTFTTATWTMPALARGTSAWRRTRRCGENKELRPGSSKNLRTEFQLLRCAGVAVLPLHLSRFNSFRFECECRLCGVCFSQSHWRTFTVGAAGAWAPRDSAAALSRVR
jgi:hypothetical protein